MIVKAAKREAGESHTVTHCFHPEVVHLWLLFLGQGLLQRGWGRGIWSRLRKKRTRASKTSSVGQPRHLKLLARCTAHAKCSLHRTCRCNRLSSVARLAGWALTFHAKNWFSRLRSACLRYGSGPRMPGSFSQQGQLATWSLVGCLFASPPVHHLGAWLFPGSVDPCLLTAATLRLTLESPTLSAGSASRDLLPSPNPNPRFPSHLCWDSSAW